MLAVVATEPQLLPRLSRDVSRIINGEDAAKGEFPWQAVLLQDGRFSCGGAVIARNWIITAAHCTKNV